MRTRLAAGVVVVCGVMAFAGCGGGGGGGGGSERSFTVGGTVSGLTGTVVLRNNGADNLSVSANGSFVFPGAVTNGGTYNVTVLTQPAGLTCSVSSGVGTISGANVANVVVICSATAFTVGGTVSGLAAGATVVLQDNGGDNLTISASGGFTFATSVANGSPYTVTVLTQPAGQNCSVASGSGTIAGANITNVTVTCAGGTYTVGGAVSGLAGNVVLQNNGADNLSVSVNGPFTFSTALTAGTPYSVTVLTQPLGQNCVVANGSGTSSVNVTNVAVTCTTGVGVWGVSDWDNAPWGP